MKRSLLLLGVSCLIFLSSAWSKTDGPDPAKQRPPESVSLDMGNAVEPERGPRIRGLHLRAAREVRSDFTGPKQAVAALKDRQARPLSLATADFDEDGVPDLVSGFAIDRGGIFTLHRGNVDAIYPNAPEARARKRNGTFTDAAFLPDSRILETPEAPDFLGAGDFDADGHWDVVAASREDERLVWHQGDGEGGFGDARLIPLQGRPTALVTGEINRRDGLTDVVVAVDGPAGPKALVFEAPVGALSGPPEIIDLSEPVLSLALDRLDDDIAVDLVIGGGETLTLVRGRDRRLSYREDRRAATAPPAVERIATPFTITGLSTGDFDADRKVDVALLDDSGTLHVAAASDLSQGPADPDPGSHAPTRWHDERALPANEADRNDTLSSAKVSSRPGDDLLVLHRAAGRIHVRPGAKSADLACPEQGSCPQPDSAELDVPGNPIAMLPMRLNMDALSDLVILSGGEASLSTIQTEMAMTYTVINTNNSGPGSLAQAIQDANANVGEADLIQFSIPGLGPHTIRPTGSLPNITDPVTIDATSEADVVVIDGSLALSTGLRVLAGNTTIIGLVLNRCSAPIALAGGFSNNRVEGCWIGLDPTGTAAAPNFSEGIELSSDNTTIGGTTSAARNVISGNDGEGIRVGSVFGLTIQGNYIGTNVAGDTPLPNHLLGGIGLLGASAATIGGTTAGAGNVISGNVRGLFIDLPSMGTLVQGNRIGTNAFGNVAVGNESEGIHLHSDSNTIGGTTPSARNLISGNAFTGIIAGAFDNGVVANLFQGNYIGTSADGGNDLGNGQEGLYFHGSDNLIGGMSAAARNVISGNDRGGVVIVSATVRSTGNDILANYIGTRATGSTTLGNDRYGISVSGDNNRIGGASSATANVISGNLHGIALSGTANLIEVNFIGTDPTGNFDLGNQEDGIQLIGAMGGFVGVKTGQANVISGNGRCGINIGNSSSVQVRGNIIGLSAPGSSVLPNGSGICIDNLSEYVMVGGSTGGFENTIAGNDTTGITLRGGANHNVIQSNRIGTNQDGSIANANGTQGIRITSNASLNTVGGLSPGEGNIIAHNLMEGVLVEDGDGNSIRGNAIYGNAALGIDLLAGTFAPHGVSPNDPLDEDGGGNKLQNYPVLASASTPGGSVHLSGSLQSLPSTPFDLDFYSVSLCDASGHGEGDAFLGSTSLTTDPAGDASFDVVLSVSLPAGARITATATNAIQGTSEFSACATVAGVPPSAVSGVVFDDGPPETLSWSAAAGADFYHVYSGTGLTMAGLASQNADSCEAVELAETGFEVPPAALPPLGHLLWVLITPENQFGEGPVQPGSNGPRILTSTGECGDSCAHDRCDVGGPLVPACDPCASIVCDKDPACCTTAWSAACVQEVRTICRTLSCPESQGQCAHDLCDRGGGPLVPGCDTPPLPVSCTAAICQVDPHCCQQVWDDACVAKVASVCGYGCL